MKKLSVAFAAAGLLTVGAFAVAAVGGASAVAAQESTPTEEQLPPRPHKGAVLDEVLAHLVSGDVITQDTADQIKAAFDERAAELREEYGRLALGFGFRRGFMMGSLLEDGVIDASELAELPEGHPLADPEGPAAEYLADGLLTREELEEMRQLHRRRVEANGAESAIPA